VEEDQLLAGYLAAVQHVGRGERPEFRHGQFHDVVLAGDVAYRFPRDEESRRALPGRVALLRVLGDCRLPVATPLPLTAAPAAHHEALGRCHVALSRLRGQPLECEQAISPQSEPIVIAELGRLLDALSELGTDPAVARVVPGADPDRWIRFASEVDRVLFPLMSERGRRRAEAELAKVAAVDPVGTALVHGDLGGTNLLWTVPESGPHLAGVLDWDEAQLGNPADDLASLAAPPRVSAALYRAAALIPGVTVVANATDAIGRHGVAVAFTYQGTRTEWIFSRQTLQYLGERDINVANGSTTGEAAVLQRAFVDHPGQLPG
jgi:aminoglycoside phosphotransferase (APT) family kinase protein